VAKSRSEVKILLNGVDLTPVFRNASVPMNRGLRAHFVDTRKALDRLERGRKAFDDALKDLEAQDKLGNFEIQQLMSAFNQAESLASSVSKKLNDTMNCLIRKMG
jgi:hypothetical protein